MNTDDIAIGPFHIYQRTDKMSKKEKYLYPLLFLSLSLLWRYICLYIYLYKVTSLNYVFIHDKVLYIFIVLWYSGR